jgi:acid phosphatase (class A)
MRFHEHTATPQFEPDLRRNFSYPSGHTILGWCSALLLAEINPERADTILKRGMMYGESRVIVGAHWQSDVDAGRLAASAAYSRMHTSERFLEQMQLARQEFRMKTGLATPAEIKAFEKAAKKRAKAKK